MPERGRELPDDVERVERVRGGPPGDRGVAHVRQRAPLHRNRPQEPDERRHPRDAPSERHPALARGHHELRQHVVQPQAPEVGPRHQGRCRRAHRQAASRVGGLIRVRRPGPRRRARAGRGQRQRHRAGRKEDGRHRRARARGVPAVQAIGGAERETDRDSDEPGRRLRSVGDGEAAPQR